MSDHAEHEQHRAPERSFWDANGLLTAVVLAVGAISTSAVGLYRIGQLEEAHKTHVAEAQKVAEKTEARDEKIEESVRTLDKGHGDRILTLEDHYNEITGLLKEIKASLADQSNVGPSHHR